MMPSVNSATRDFADKICERLVSGEPLNVSSNEEPLARSDNDLVAGRVQSTSRIPKEAPKATKDEVDLRLSKNWFI